eukprot:Seg1747.2 transcript_id=Seg1747.2/GoldUCD/mRNA.D3Y31 product="hypothetical protein" protein_id=Seg1747.2/GoldUCD/D3Y31
MDVPYDPACPLSIDSDDQSFENDEEIEQRVRDKLLEITPKEPKFLKKANGEQKSLSMWKSISSQPETKFVPAFEDDDTELLDYCLKESGFLSDDNFDIPLQKEDTVAKDETHSQDIDSQESLDLSLVKEDELETQKHKKKRKKHKDEHKSRKDEGKNRHKSSKDREKTKHDDDRGRWRSKEKKDGDKNEKKSDKKNRKSLNKSTSSFNDTMDADSPGLNLIDSVDIFAVANEDIFPLSKAEDKLNHSHEKKSKKDAKEGKGLVKTPKEGKDRRRSKDMKDKEKKKEILEKDSKSSKAKRKRSKSRHRRSSSSDSEPQRKKKKRSKDKSKERSDKDRKRDKSKNDTKREKKKKEVSDVEKSDEKAKRHKKKRKHSDRKSESQIKDSHKKTSVSEDSPHRKKLKENTEDKSKDAPNVKKPKVAVEVRKHHESKSKSSTHREHRKHDKEHSKEHKDHKRRDRKESEIKSERKEPDTKSERKESNSKAERKESNSKPERTESESKSDKKGFESKSDRKEFESKSDRKEFESKSDRKELESKSEKKQSHSKSEHVSEKKEDPKVVESKKLDEKESMEEGEIKVTEDKLKSNDKVSHDKGLLGQDTDSEFERLSDMEREIEEEKSIEESAAPIKKETAAGVEEEVQLVDEAPEASGEMKLQLDSSKGDAQAEDNQESKHSGDDGLPSIDNTLEKLELDSSSKEGQSGTNNEKLVSPMESSSMLPSGEKRIFKLFSREETQKLHKELLSKDKETTMDITEEVVNEIAEKGEMDAEPEIELSESMEKGVIKATEITVAEMVKESVSGVEDNDLNEIPIEMPVENEGKMEDLSPKVEDLSPKVEDLSPKVDDLSPKVKDLSPKEEDIIVEKEVKEVEKKKERKSEKKSRKALKKSKDDLFDDIFSKEDKGTKETDGLAEMLGDDDTSPKRSSHRKHHHQSGSSNARKSLKEDYAKKERESPIKKIPQLKMENGKYDGKKSKSPEETIIPGLEPVVSIPGLESPMKDEVTEVEREISESKIPLLFDDEPSPEKTGVPKTPELSPEEEQELKKRQPYTPPEEFTGEPENNQFDSYYHIEADDSPYNPEDLMPMDMDFSPVDASNIQRDALKEAVQMRLKEPFSGYENPTWEKIIKAKSKHELKRQKRKSHQEKGRSHEHRPSRQQKTVDMLVRQSRVEQECKEVLKGYYKSKEITKEEYKTILRKAVPQVTMSNRPIIPEKIQSLMKKFVRKCKGHRLTEPKQESKRRKPMGLSPPSFSQGLTFPGEQRFRYLNPNLPMPPM